MSQTTQNIHWSSISYNWDTPLEIFTELNEEFHFNLDPTNRPIGGLRGLKDGIRMPYFIPSPGGRIKARVFNNPPYKRGMIKAYVEKTIREIKLGRCSVAVFLIPLRNSDYLKLLRKAGAEFRLCEKRIKFGDADDSAGVKKDKVMDCPHCKKEILLKKAQPNGNNSAPFDSVVAIIRA